MSELVKINGKWISTEKQLVRHEDTWKTIDTKYYKHNDVWSLVYQDLKEFYILEDTKRLHLENWLKEQNCTSGIVIIHVGDGSKDVYIGSTSTAYYALQTGNLRNFEKVTLVISPKGYIVGAGGRGGTGANAPSTGGAGGGGATAMRITSPITIDNKGVIGGGGGGGGGSGGYQYNATIHRGGGGGGGQGDIGGAGGGTQGGPGGWSGTRTGPGRGGLSSGSHNGGDGGALGVAGKEGASNPNPYYGSKGGPGGPPGYAITGNSNVTWINQGTIYGGLIN